MSERLTPWTIAEGLEKYARTDELLALRARVAKLEEVIQTQNGVVVSGTLKLNEARARVAKLEGDVKIIETSFTDVCDALGCPYDNEAALFAVDALRARVGVLEAGGEPNSYEARMDAYGKKIDELMVRNARLEAAAKAYVSAVDRTSFGLSNDTSHYERVAETRNALLAVLKDGPR